MQSLSDWMFERVRFPFWYVAPQSLLLYSYSLPGEILNVILSPLFTYFSLGVTVPYDVFELFAVTLNLSINIHGSIYFPLPLTPVSSLIYSVILPPLNVVFSCSEILSAAELSIIYTFVPFSVSVQ